MLSLVCTMKTTWKKTRGPYNEDPIKFKVGLKCKKNLEIKEASKLKKNLEMKMTQKIRHSLIIR